jgi:hypothetical protein
MIGHLYRYPHPHDPTRFIYVGQGPKRDSKHRSGKEGFGRRFKKLFPADVLPQPIREQVEVKDQSELNELETVWMFQYHTWRGYNGGMNLTFPGSDDYKRLGMLGGSISGQRNAESGRMSKIGKTYGPVNGRKMVDSGRLLQVASSGGKIGGTKSFRLYGNPRTKEGSIKGGRASGKKNAENGHMSSLGRVHGGRYAHVLVEYRTIEHQSQAGKLGGQKHVASGHIQSLGRKSSAPGGPLAKARHERWHVKRDIISDTCSFCKS